MKRLYVKPSIEVFHIETSHQLLAASSNDYRRMRVTGLEDDFEYDGEDNGWDAW